MNNLELVLVIAIMASILNALLNPVYVFGDANSIDPYFFTMEFDPQVVSVYETVHGVGVIYYVFPYSIPVPLVYRLEYDKKAYKPWAVEYHDLPPLSFKIGNPRWVNETGVHYYESGVIWRQGSGELWISFKTSTAYVYDYHYGAVGDAMSLWPEYDSSYFVAEPRVGSPNQG